MIRVLQVHWAALPVIGGVEVHCAALTEQLIKLGVDAEVVSGTPNPSVGSYEPALAIGRIATPADLHALLLRCQAADTVHWHNPQWHKPDVTQQIIDHLRKDRWPGRFVFDLHNIDDLPLSWKFLRELSDSYVVHSEFVREEIHARLPDAEVQLLPLALSERREAYKLPRHAGYVALQPTRLTTWKGSDLSLRAVLLLLEREGADLALVHAGTRNLVWPSNIDPALLEQIQPWRQQGRIQFVHYEPAQSWSAFDAADVILHPTADRGAHGEPFSLSVAQAIICGRPVIASDSGNLPALLAGYTRGRIVPSGDQDALTDALRDALESPLAAEHPADRKLAQDLAERFASAGGHYLDRYHEKSPELSPTLMER